MKTKYKVLCIGVNRVPVENWHELKYAEKDAFYAAKSFEILKDKADVTLLTGENATRENIIHWVTQCSAIEKELNIIIFFAGHGSAEKEESSDSLSRCLWIDSRNKNDIKTEDHKIKTAEILSRLDNPAHRLIFIIDACYNFGKKEMYSMSINDVFKKFKESERKTSLKHYAIFSASAVSTFAFEDYQVRHGVLAYHFLKAISGRYTFFLRKKIAFFKFLEILDKKVRNHGFITDTGRKRPLKMLMENGLMVHWSGKNFELPVLEPKPFIFDPDPGKNRFQQKISQLVHFFSCTRLRTKILSLACLLGIILFLTFMAHFSLVCIYFESPRYAIFSKFLGTSGFYLEGLSNRMVNQDNDRKIFYLFKQNWTEALRHKLNEEGKIVLLGNLLGEPFTGVNEKEMVRFALSNREDVFYWYPGDVSRLLKVLRGEYDYFSNKKWEMMQLLAKLGKNGMGSAQSIFDFDKETNQRLRNLFLKHFYSVNFLEKHFDTFNKDDLLYVLRNKKQFPLSLNGLLGDKIGKYLRDIVQSLSDFDSNIEIANTERLSEIYEKLEILACVGSFHFQSKASAVFKKSFDPQKSLYLASGCRNFKHSLWVLDRYFQYLRSSGQQEMPWEHWQSIESFIKTLTLKEKSMIKKDLVDNEKKFQFLPKFGMDFFLWSLRDCDPGVIQLKDWQKWFKSNKITPYLALNATIKMKYPQVFCFIENHYPEFKGKFSEFTLEALSEIDKPKTIRLVRKLYPKASPKDKFFFAVFLYNRNFKEYSPYIVQFLRESRKDKDKQKILAGFYEKIINKALRKIDNEEHTIKEEIRYFLQDQRLLYNFYTLLLQWWPNEAMRIILDTRISRRYNEGIPILRVCEKLPHPHRKKMLFKLCQADTDETFKLNTELSLAKHYPREFIKLVGSGTYAWNQFTRRQVVKAYQRLSPETLRQELILNFRKGVYWKIDIICEALIKKEDDKELDIKVLEHLLKEFNRPLERILLRRLRHYLHEHYFQEVS